MQYRITHSTEYWYAQPVTLCHNEVHLRPRDTHRQRCLSQRLEVLPAPALFSERKDFFDNPVCYFSIESPHDQLSVVATSVVELHTDVPVPHGYSTMAWDELALTLRTTDSAEIQDARQFLLDSPLISVSPDIAHYAANFFPAGRSLSEAVHDLMACIYRDFIYDPGFTTVTTPPAAVLQHRRGVCQDFAHLAIACLRSQSLAARYVSGYIETLPPFGCEKLIGADASHAWFSVYDPQVGWLDFDPTNNQIPMERHITTAWGRDYSDITPLKGIVIGGGAHTARVSVDVTSGYS